MDADFDKIFAEECGNVDVKNPSIASEIDAAFDAIYNESAKTLEEENEDLTNLNFELLVEKQDAEKRETDLLEKLEKATIAEQTSSARLQELQKENERLRSAQVRTLTEIRAAEEAKVEKTMTGPELYLAKKSMLRTVSLPPKNMDTVEKTAEDEGSKSRIPKLAPVTMAKKPSEMKKECGDEKQKAKKERRPSIFANLTKRLKDDKGKSDKEKQSAAAGSMKK